MTTLYAQPYDISTMGFYFDSDAEYQAKAAQNCNDCGAVVEEYEIQFIDGASIDARLFATLDIHQGNFAVFLEAVEAWNHDDKIRAIIAVGEAGLPPEKWSSVK